MRDNFARLGDTTLNCKISRPAPGNSAPFSAGRGEGAVVALAVDPDGPLCGVVILGGSGAGKSRLVLEIVETCPWRRARLVADDAFEMVASNGRVIASAPTAIKGLVEIRGFGPAPLACRETVALRAAFRLTETSPRLPDPTSYGLAGVQLPLWPFVPNAGAGGRIRTILRAILAGQTP